MTRHYRRNRRRVAAGLGFAPDKLFGLNNIIQQQLFYCQTRPTLPRQRPDADAFVTTRRDVALAILTADCARLICRSRSWRYWRGTCWLARGKWWHFGIDHYMMCDNGAALSASRR